MERKQEDKSNDQILFNKIVIKRSDIKNPPEGATHILLNPNGTISLFYRLDKEKVNGRGMCDRLQYYSYSSTWQGTGENDIETYIKNKLIKIID